MLVTRKNAPLGLELSLKDLSVSFTSWSYIDRKPFGGKDKAVCICCLYVPVNLPILSGDIKAPSNLCHIEHLTPKSVKYTQSHWDVKRTNEFSASRWPGHTRRPAPKLYVALRWSFASSFPCDPNLSSKKRSGENSFPALYSSCPRWMDHVFAKTIVPLGRW